MLGLVMALTFDRFAAIRTTTSILKNWIGTVFTPHSFTYLLNFNPNIFIDRFGATFWEDVVL